MTSLLASVESRDQCLLNSDVLSCFSGIIMSTRSLFLSDLRGKRIAFYFPKIDFVSIVFAVAYKQIFWRRQTRGSNK